MSGGISTPLPAAQLSVPANAPYGGSDYVTFAQVDFDSGGFTTGGAPYTGLNVTPGLWQVSFSGTATTGASWLLTAVEFAGDVEVPSSSFLGMPTHQSAANPASRFIVQCGLRRITAGTDNLRLFITTNGVVSFTPQVLFGLTKVG